jgi:DNA-binding response OmpR family regulator
MRQDEGQVQSGVPAAPRSIVVVGDDPLMVRALNRLLRTAGYCVGVGERAIDQTMARGTSSPRSDIALTIVDLPDDWSRRNQVAWQPEEARATSHGKVLWISAAPEADGDAEGCLVKPFTSNQLLDKVRTLLNRQPPL